VSCWGENSGGRGGPPNRNFGFVRVSAGANHNCAKRNDASIFCWGDNAFGQLIPTNPNSGFFDLDAGDLVTCAVRLFGDLDCWGESGYQVDDPSPTFFKWTGFLSPILNPPAVNSAPAGTIVVLPFKLGSDEGLDIFSSGFPTVKVCGGGGAQPASGQLVYDAATNTYFYLWQTEAAWAGSCRRITLGLRDGTHHTALVQF
jgi:Regulator of chromosome condensation (RCC1) repeat